MKTNPSLPAPPGSPVHKFYLTVIFLSLNVIIGAGVCVLAGNATERNELPFIGIVIIALFFLFLLSVLISALLTYTVRRGMIAPQAGSPLEKLVKFWEKLVPPYDVRPILDLPIQPVTEVDHQEGWVNEFTPADVDELLAFIINKKGGGRKSDIPDEARFRAVRDWILMQMRGTSVRLQDFLDERFGYHPNGEPRVPRDTFYGWYKKFKKMLTEYKSSKSV